MARQHVVQHRPSEKRNREVSDLKKENHQLRRKVARLQRLLQKALETPAPAEAVEARPDAAGCPECGSAGIVQFRLPSGGIIRGCKTCGWRKKT